MCPNANTLVLQELTFPGSLAALLAQLPKTQLADYTLCLLPQQTSSFGHFIIPIHNPGWPRSSDLTREAPSDTRTELTMPRSQIRPSSQEQGQQQPTTGLGFTCKPHLSWTQLCLLEPRLPILAHFREVIVQRTGDSQEASACPGSARHVTSDKLTSLSSEIPSSIWCFNNTAK